MQRTICHVTEGVPRGWRGVVRPEQGANVAIAADGQVHAMLRRQRARRCCPDVLQLRQARTLSRHWGRIMLLCARCLAS
jgi:hypothetical protein